MKYIANHADGTTLIVDSKTYDTSTPLVLSGFEYSSYDKTFWSNIVHLLENFSSPYSPNNAVNGQVWYDNLNQKLKLFSNKTWVNLSPYTGDASNFVKPGAKISGNLVVNTPKSANSIANRKYVESQQYTPVFVPGNVTYVKHSTGYITAQTTVSSVTSQINLPVTMTDCKYVVICNVNTTSDVAENTYCTVYDKTPTSFKISVVGVFDTVACVITGFAL